MWPSPARPVLIGPDSLQVAQAPVPSGREFIYRFAVAEPGTYWYHPMSAPNWTGACTGRVAPAGTLGYRAQLQRLDRGAFATGINLGGQSSGKRRL